MADLGTSRLAALLSTQPVPDSGWSRQIARNTARTTMMTAATAFYARRTADAAQIAAESSIRQEAQLDQLQNLVAEQTVLLEAQQEQNREVLEIQQQLLWTQQQTSWMQYRQTPDGQEFMGWGRRAAALLDRFDRVNEEWLAASQAEATRMIPAWEWQAEESGDYLPPNHPSKSGTRRLLRQAVTSFTDDEDVRNLVIRKEWEAENQAHREWFISGGSSTSAPTRSSTRTRCRPAGRPMTSTG